MPTALMLQDKLVHAAQERCSSRTTRAASNTRRRKLGLCRNEFRLPVVPISDANETGDRRRALSHAGLLPT